MCLNNIPVGTCIYFIYTFLSPFIQSLGCFSFFAVRSNSTFLCKFLCEYVCVLLAVHLWVELLGHTITVWEEAMFNSHSPFPSEFLQEVQSLLLPQTPSLTWIACSWSLYFPGLLWPSWHPPSSWRDAKGGSLWMSHLQTPVCTLEHSLVLGQVSKAASAILGHRAGERREHWLSVSHLCVHVCSVVSDSLQPHGL